MFNKLNRVEIIEKEENKYLIVITPPIDLEKKYACCITDLENEYFYGYIHNLDSHYYFEMADDGKLESSKKLFIIETYWAKQIELILSKEIVWEKILFSIDGILEYQTKSIVVTDQNVLLNKTYVENQLYHEHCEICMNKITIENNIGYYSNPYNFLCISCWENYKEKENIEFVDWEQNFHK
jgi:hypothetical protein